jgi:hypothetical protein
MKPILPLIAFLLLWQPFSILAQGPNPAPRSTETDYTFHIAANQLWTDTNLNLHPGDHVHITGAVMACEGPAPAKSSTSFSQLRPLEP